MLVSAAGLWLVAQPAAANPAPGERDRIERLLRAMERQTDVNFERNGRLASARDAVRFLRAKWERHGGDVDSAEGFIERIASRSSTSGRPYLIRHADGREQPAAAFLHEELQRLELRP